MTEQATSPLTGKALLQKVKELSNVPRRETAKACGYVTTAKDNKVRVNLADFYDAILAAKGVAIESQKDGRGREASYRVSVHQNGQIVIGANYTAELGLQPGDEFEIKLGYKHIRLVKIENGEVEALAADNNEVDSE